MSEKLTLRMERAVIQRAKRYARARGKSVSRLVADYFALLEPTSPQPPSVEETERLPPVTRSLLGSLSGADLDESDYRRHLEEKHG